MFQEETIFDFVRTFFQYEMNPFTKGHNLALIADYLVREHAETVGETTNN